MADNRGRGIRGGRGGRGRGRGSSQGRGSRQSVQSLEAHHDGQQEYNAHLSERFNGRRIYQERHEDKFQQAEMNGLHVKLNPKIREYVEQQNAICACENAEGWLAAPEIAGSDEVSMAENASVMLLANKIDRPYKSASKYLKTHYKLLREDAVGPLREAVDKFKSNPDNLEEFGSNIYEKVYVCGFTFTSIGVAARIQFSTRRATRRIAWKTSKRLVSGTLVALSPVNDQFKSQCKMAVVAARPLNLLETKPPQIDLYFSRPEDAEVDPQQEFIMIEATDGYYEAYRHTLRALQKMSSESFPLSDLVLARSTNPQTPSYLSALPNRNLSAVCKEDSSFDMTSVDVVNDWPASHENTTLDATQWNALKQILTRNLAIIQGPPGTGKTHVSKIALQIMIENRSKNDPPIIIAAQTNHALDQLLEHVSVFEENYVRLGGRSTNDEIKKHALFEIQTKERIPNIPGSKLGKARRDLDFASAKFGNIISLFGDSVEPISAETLLRLSIITEKQCQSLQDAVKNWVTADSAGLSAVQHWLHKALIPFEVHPDEEAWGAYDDNEDDDAEFEQVNEIDAEHGVDDVEDIEQLKGPWKAVNDRWTVSEPTEHDLERAKQLLDIRQDLWTVPDDLRGPMYVVMRQRATSLARLHFCEALKEYNSVVQELKIGKWEKDSVYLQRANIIGMTTTGLSKYRPLISSLQPRIVLIEEAAEVIEGPVAAACIESLEHLILVGDHQQLQGHCSIRELAGPPYNLNISMFQRLVNMNLPFQMLLRQRRMRSEFRQLISPLYPLLEDHPDVYEREVPRPWGMGSIHSFFFAHEWMEMKDSHKSTYNEEEAMLVVKFYRHLLRNGLPPAAVTILTFYNGQRRRILRELRNDPETAASINIVKTVDSYQGEENDVIILSLVRSNTEGQIGFLDIDNRVCVALSRARYGFYLFGNAELLSKTSRLWLHVSNSLDSTQPKRIGHKLPITCQEHNRTLLMQYPADFDSNNGGCELLCRAILSCGHPCPEQCHPYPHSTIKCQWDCSKYVDEMTGQQSQDTASHESLLQSNSSSYPTGYSGKQLPTTTNYVHGNLPYSLRGAKSGHKLARGGGSFQQASLFAYHPDHVYPDASTSGVGHGTPGWELSHPQTSADWTDFAEGGVQETDRLIHEAETSPSKYRDKGVQVDLPGLSQWAEHTSPVVSQTQQNIHGGKMRFVQEYRPGGLPGTERPGARWDTRSPSIQGDW